MDVTDLRQPPTDPAFPGLVQLNGGYPGMTLRDYFAAHAPVPRPEVFFSVIDDEQDAVVMAAAAERAYKWADAMLVARNKETR